MTLKCFKTILNDRQGAEMLRFAEGTCGLTELSIFLSKGLWSSIAERQFIVLLKTITQHWQETGGATVILPKTNFCESGLWLRLVSDLDVSLRDRMVTPVVSYLGEGRKNKQNPCHLITEEQDHNATIYEPDIQSAWIGIGPQNQWNQWSFTD